MGELKNPHLYDFGIFGRVPEPQNQYYLSLETPGYVKQFKKQLWIICENIIFIDVILEIHKFGNFRKDGHRQIVTIRLVKS